MLLMRLLLLQLAWPRPNTKHAYLVPACFSKNPIVSSPIATTFKFRSRLGTKGFSQESSRSGCHSFQALLPLSHDLSHSNP
ncbi:hypothetical protein M758_UG203300 [Ceratodon purpureus]|nr:hypothetical protein M758_UG203300 [Ceratodon purpureus]